MRGRGLGRLIEGISNGDPVAIGVAVVAALVVIAVTVYKIKSRSEG